MLGYMLGFQMGHYGCRVFSGVVLNYGLHSFFIFWTQTRPGPQPVRPPQLRILLMPLTMPRSCIISKRSCYYAAV